MATTLIAEYAAAYGNLDFISRVVEAMEQTMVNMKDEPTSTINHANRMALMKAAANNPQPFAALFAPAITSQGVDMNSTDAQVQAMVATCWNELAGMP